MLPVYLATEKELKKRIDATKSGKLFPHLKRKNDRLTHYVSNRLNALIRKEVTKDKRFVVHSIRHSFIDACRATGMPESLRYHLGGHLDKEANAVAEGYGKGHSIEKINKWLRKVDPLKLL